MRTVETRSLTWMAGLALAASVATGACAQTTATNAHRDSSAGGCHLEGLRPVKGGPVTHPRLVREVRPNYTQDAMARKINGSVLLEAIVREDGTIGDVCLVRSLDREFGLDQEAVKAARQWSFEPATKDGKPVPVVITLELTFLLR